MPPYPYPIPTPTPTLPLTKAKPLPPQLLWEVDRVHMRNRLPIFSSTRVGAEWDGEGEIGEPLP